MMQIIPKDQYKSAMLGKDLEVTGYKSRVYDYSPPNSLNKPKLDLGHSELSFTTGDFALNVRGRKELQKLKKVIDFALETKKKKKKK